MYERCSESNASYFIMLVVWQWRLNLPVSSPLRVVSVQQMAAEGQTDQTVSGVEVHIKQRYVTEFLNVEKMVPIDIP